MGINKNKGNIEVHDIMTDKSVDFTWKFVEKSVSLQP